MINKLIFELTSLRESAIYQELETLTREIHDSINAFANDNQLVELAQEGIPDARERLNYMHMAQLLWLNRKVNRWDFRF